MRQRILLCTIFIVFNCTLLISCSKDHDAKKEVDQLVKNIESASQTTQKAAEKTGMLKPVVYEGEKLRDPFEEPITSRTGKQYTHTILKDVALDSLKFVGVVVHDQFRWALFRANDGKLYKFSVGTRVGVENSLLTQIDENQVKFIQESEGVASETTTPGTVATTTSTPAEMTREIVIHLQEPKK